MVGVIHFLNSNNMTAFTIIGIIFVSIIAGLITWAFIRWIMTILYQFDDDEYGIDTFIAIVAIILIWYNILKPLIIIK
jgi:hypothetical protein